MSMSIHHGHRFRKVAATFGAPFGTPKRRTTLRLSGFSPEMGLFTDVGVLSAWVLDGVGLSVGCGVLGWLWGVGHGARLELGQSSIWSPGS